MTDVASWAWVGGNHPGPLDDTFAGGFVPLGGYTEDFYYRDVNDNGLIGDTDGSSQPTAGEGLVVDGTFHQIAQLTGWSSIVTMNDGTTFTGGVFVHRLDDGTLIYNFHNNLTNAITAAGYARYNIASIKLDSMSSGSNFENLTYGNSDAAFPCFVRGSIVKTISGDVPIEQLSSGDMVLTRDNGYQMIRWIGSRKLSSQALERNVKLRPVRIRAGALGEGLPVSDLVVSPQHRILIRSKIAQRMFDSSEVLIAAIHLTDIDGIERDMDISEVEYFHFLFERHEIVTVNGLETESLYTGPQALKVLPQEAVCEIFEIFPQLKQCSESPVTARMFIRGQQARKLIRRHIKNGRNGLAAI
ncbi:MAG: Hint domain-containing protein [Paracoccus sp. (in: a-proteobacteria)]